MNQDFSRKKNKRDISIFTKKYGCEECLYKRERMKCYIAKICPVIEDEIKRVISRRNSTKCSKDVNGNCPYGNEVGTCFGYCWKELLSK